MTLVNQEYKKYIDSNPYKGFVPFMGNYNLDCAMEFFYIPLKAVVIKENLYNWQKLEKNLKIIFERKHKAIIRFYLDYPEKESGIPNFLKSKINLVSYLEFGGGFSPDYNNMKLIKILLDFIYKFAKKYDGDKRIAFIELGLIGHWGEWHTYPHDYLMLSKKFQKLIVKAYSKSFKKTKLLIRYPNSRSFNNYRIGFHDDSFCFSTLPTKSHHFITLMQNNKLCLMWYKVPIGGEVRPEEQEKLLKENNTTENYYDCVNNTHASFLICHKAFTDSYDLKKIKELSSYLGYDFYLDNIELNDNILSFSLKNKGVAPLYYKFNCYLLIGTKRVLLKYDIRKLLPNTSKIFCYKLGKKDLRNKIYFALKNNDDYIVLSNKYLDNSLVELYKP